jgi:hypothetical protein
MSALLPRPLDADPFALSAPGVLDALLGQTGLMVLSSRTVACTAEYPDEELFWQAQASAGLLQAVLRVVGAPLLKAALLRAAAPCSTAVGGVRMLNDYRLLTTVPALERG